MTVLTPPCSSSEASGWLAQLEWMCTHPVPLHAHTHFLAGFRATLILNAGQAVPAPAPVTLCILQDLHHTCLVDGVNALRGINTQVQHKNISSSELAQR